MYTWGYGLLGNSIEPCLSETPQKLTSLDKRVAKLGCGLEHYVLLTGEGVFFSKQMEQSGSPI